MTYNVFSGTLNPTQSINLGSVVSSPAGSWAGDEFSKFWSFQNASAETWKQLLAFGDIQDLEKVADTE